MKKYLKPEMVLQIIEYTDVLTTSNGFFGQEFDNGNDDIGW